MMLTTAPGERPTAAAAGAAGEVTASLVGSLLAVGLVEAEGPVEGDEEVVTTVGQGELLATSMLIVTAVYSVEPHWVR